jgi:hypothetical protein
MLVDMFLVLLVLVRDMLPVMLVLVLLLRPRGTFAFLLVVALVFFASCSFGAWHYGCSKMFCFKPTFASC